MYHMHMHVVPKIQGKALTALNNKVFQDMSPPALNDKAFQGKSPHRFEQQSILGHESSRFERQGVPGQKPSRFYALCNELHLCISTYNINNSMVYIRIQPNNNDNNIYYDINICA